MTREEWRERLPLIQALVDGKRVQFYTDEGGWEDDSRFGFGGPVNEYRIAPEPKLRPWTAEEVPVGAVLRYKNNKSSCRFLITASTEINMMGYGTYWKYSDIFDCCEHSTDGGKTWLPCGVLEGEK